MELARSSLLNAISGIEFGAGGYTPTAFTPPNNCLLIAFVGMTQNAGDTDPSGDISISDTETLTWTSRKNIGNASSWSCGLRVFTAPVTTGVEMSVTVDCGARTAWQYCVQIFAETGYDTGAPTGATDSNGNAGTDGSLSLTLSGAPASTSEVFGALYKSKSGSGTMVSLEGSGWTELYDQSPNDADSEAMQTQVRGSSTSTDVPWQDINNGTGTVSKSVALALEIKAVGGVSNTDRSPTIGSAALTGIASRMALGMRPLIGSGALTGVAPRMNLGVTPLAARRVGT